MCRIIWHICYFVWLKYALWRRLCQMTVVLVLLWIWYLYYSSRTNKCCLLRKMLRDMLQRHFVKVTFIMLDVKIVAKYFQNQIYGRFWNSVVVLYAFCVTKLSLNVFSSFCHEILFQNDYALKFKNCTCSLFHAQ